MTNLEEQWSTYLPDQYELVKNRLEEKYGDYLIYIISNFIFLWFMAKPFGEKLERIKIKYGV